MVLKKSLTPPSKKSRVVVNQGKGSSSQRMRPGDGESVTSANPVQRALNTYPAAAQPPPNVAGAAPAPGGAAPPPGGSIGPQPTANMPGGGLPEPE
jgi:hypothetical protein